MTPTKKALAVVAVAATGLISACSSNATTDASPAGADRQIVDKSIWPEETPVRGLTKGLKLPLEDYMLSYADTVAIDEAKNALQKQCMAEYGFTVDFPAPGANPPPSNNDANIERRYGITDETVAKTYGYGIPEELTHHTDQRMQELSDVEVEVLTGHTKPEKAAPPKDAEAGEPYFAAAPRTKPARAEHNGKKLREGGCAGWSDEQLGAAKQQADAFTVSDLNGDSLVRSQQSEPVQNVFKDWSSCMKTKGHAGLADPYKAMDAGLALDKDGKATAESIRMALDDIACKEKTDLVKVWFDEESKIQRQQIEDNRAQLDSAKKSKKAVLAEADAQ
ncbi:hypothetical protein LIX60_26900 [Streptomyces sp. S07_1.15]|uniref:hypothetical protein n=1 Tax=Streptomyces sp. S07_1.15 TaxID=2873925 RepID=UPI001D159098|nr:hypothetical protein [Streptomyces sp. S07_1.15]MCC3655033.1 hypothetical protein [Streptomyces sp. S07_1.15]